MIRSVVNLLFFKSILLLLDGLRDLGAGTAERQVAPVTHRQAPSALLFLHGKVLGVQQPWMSEIGRPRPNRRLPVVLSRDEVAALRSGLASEWQLLGQLLYGTGLRISEGLPAAHAQCPVSASAPPSSSRCGKGANQASSTGGMENTSTQPKKLT